MNILKKDQKNIWHPYTQMNKAKPPIVITRGEGAYLFDEDGNKYIDAISSWWVNTHGHAHPYIIEKVSEQLRILEHVIFAGFTHPKAVELSERLLKVLPGNQSKIFFSDNGSTAVEVALKMALQYWYNNGITKTKIIAFKNGYHGDTFGAMSVSGRGAFTKPFNSLLFDVIHIDVPVNCSVETRHCLASTFEQLKTAITGNDTAAFIFEPLVQGAAGMVMYEPEALEDLIKYCKEYNVLTIADEVMTGFGRTGNFFATDCLSVKPDIICMSKGLTGGTMALGVTSCTLEIYDAFLSAPGLPEEKTFFHGHSYTANPLACAAACASMDLFDKPETLGNIKRIEQKHKDFVTKVKNNHAIKEIRQKGTILAIELLAGEETSYFNPLRDKLYDFFLKRGIIIRPLGNVIYVLPPYCISDDDLDFIYAAIADYLKVRSE
ncbi:MAG: adenosylmethionine--8-amino-7-oxononanoate transaminase [Bacteroidota bacterium]